MSTRKATVGEAIGMNWSHEGHVDHLVQPSCGAAEGRHYCATHPAALLDISNMTFNSHLEGPGRHVEVWICSTHGPEVP